MTKFSAYLQIYNDWSLLPVTLRSLKGRIDELLVVDGAYEWMVPYVTAIGKDPRKSDAQVYEALDASGIPYRAIQRVWKNQLQKRITAYQACSHDLIFRVDADEVLFFDDSILERLLVEGYAVGDMEMPLYLAPGWLVADRRQPEYPRQCFFFDRRQVDAELHLNYLWLVLEADRLPISDDVPYPVYPIPLAFNAHLSTWRTADTSANRTAYYTTNWMRGNGVPWLPSLAGKPLTNFSLLFDQVPPQDFLQIIETSQSSLGKVAFEPHEVIVPSRQGIERESMFVDQYGVFLDSLVRHNHAIANRNQAYIQGLPLYLDVTTDESRAEILDGDTLVLETDTQQATGQASLHVVHTQSDGIRVTPLETEIDDRRLSVTVPQDHGEAVLRQVIEVSMWVQVPKELQHFRVGSRGL